MQDSNFNSTKRQRAPSWTAAAAIILSSTMCAQAQTSPGKTITIVVPYTAGSGADTIARSITESLREKLNQVVVVENRVGASGNIGTYSVARAVPDGTTLLLAANTIVMNMGLFKTPGYDPLKSFAPIIEVATGHMALATNRELPPNTIQEFVSFAKARPDSINYASPGRGTPHHLAMELLQATAGTKMVHVPYSGLAKAVTDLVGAHVSAMFVGLHSIKPLADESKVKILGVGSRQRVASAPQIATISEQGLLGFEVEAWFGLFAPAGTPPETIKQLNDAMNEALKKPDMIAILEKQGLDVVGGSPDQLTQLLVQDLKKWLTVIREAGISTE